MMTSEVRTYEPGDFQTMIREMGPSFLDSSLRQSIWMIWMALPEGKREIESFKKIVRDRYERILSEMAEDIELFEINPLGETETGPTEPE